MSAVEAGTLIFRLQEAGAQAFRQAVASTETETRKLVDTTKKASDAIDEQGESTSKARKKQEEALPSKRKFLALTTEETAAARELAAGLAVAGAAVGALVTLSVVKYTQFSAAMSNVRAATMATTKEQKELADAALKAGADTAYSATEAAAAEEELAKAGLSVSEIVGGSLAGALSLAAAGQLDVARSAEIMATTLKQFGLEGRDASHVSDLLAAGAGKAQGSVDDLALALGYVGPVAAGLGLSIEETSGALALFASQGQLGERAGTGLRGVLMSLTAPSALGAKTMEDYGIAVFDANGKMRSLAQISESMKTALGGLTEAERSAALGRIFGNEQITAARVLYAGGAKAVNQWTDAVNDSGYAAEQAAMRQDNLAGDIEKLGGALDTAFIQTGSGANDVLRDTVQLITQLVDWFGEADPAVQQTTLVLGAATAATLLFSGGALGLVTKVGQLKESLKVLNLSLKGTAITAGTAGLALSVVIGAFVAIASAQAEAEQRAKSYADTLEKSTQSVTRSTREMAKEALSAKASWSWLLGGDSAYDAAKKLGLGLDDVTDAALGNAEAFEAVRDAAITPADVQAGLKSQEEYDAALKASGLNAHEYANAVGTVRGALEEQTGALDRAKEIQKQKEQADHTSAEGSKTAAEAYLEAAEGAETLTKQLDDLIAKIHEANGIGQDAITANIDYRDALTKVDEQIEEARKGTEGYSLGLDQNTQAGRDNLAMLVDLAKNAWDAAQAQHDLDHDTDAYRQRLEESRQALIQRAEDFGYTEEQAKALADQILAMPTESEWKVIADTATAASAIDTFVRTYNGKSITVQLQADQVMVGGKVYSGLVSRNAEGGFYPAVNNVVKHFADGGENHVAQSARAGEYRIWAEPETGGETYIPHAISKRAQSTALLRKTATEFGFALVPLDARRAPSDAQIMTGKAVASSRSEKPREIRGTLRLEGGEAYIKGVVSGDFQ